MKAYTPPLALCTRLILCKRPPTWFGKLVTLGVFPRPPSNAEPGAVWCHLLHVTYIATALVQADNASPLDRCNSINNLNQCWPLALYSSRPFRMIFGKAKPDCAIAIFTLTSHCHLECS